MVIVPLTMAKQGEENIVRRVLGYAGVHRHLENLGFVVGAKVKVINGYRR